MEQKWNFGWACWDHQYSFFAANITRQFGQLLILKFCATLVINEHTQTHRMSSSFDSVNWQKSVGNVMNPGDVSSSVSRVSELFLLPMFKNSFTITYSLWYFCKETRIFAFSLSVFNQIEIKSMLRRHSAFETTPKSLKLRMFYRSPGSFLEEYFIISIVHSVYQSRRQTFVVDKNVQHLYELFRLILQ